MHYRRMDPQPEWLAISKPRTVTPGLAPDRVKFHPGLWGAVVFGGELEYRECPADMRGASPWQDSDGDWYWRSAPSVCGACDKPGEHCSNQHGICTRAGGRPQTPVV